MKKFKVLKLMTFGLLALQLVGAGNAADFPQRDIRFIVPWQAGGGTDAIARKLNNIIETKIDKSIYVENIEGAVSANGLIQMMKARPDGHTLSLLTYDSVITIPRGNLVPGYSLDNVKFIARVTQEADSIVVSKQSGITSFDGLIQAAKEKPGVIRIGVAPEGSGPYLAVRRLESMLDIKFNVITYPGASTAETEALLSGELDAAISSLGDFSGVIKSGDVVPLVELSAEQNPSFPDVPPISKFGHDLQAGSFIVIVAPKNTPDDVVSTLESLYKAAYDTDEFQSWITGVGVTPSWLGSADVPAWIEEKQTQTFATMDQLGL